MISKPWRESSRLSEGATSLCLRPVTATSKSYTLSKTMLTCWLYRTMTCRKSSTNLFTQTISSEMVLTEKIELKTWNSKTILKQCSPWILSKNLVLQLEGLALGLLSVLWPTRNNRTHSPKPTWATIGKRQVQTKLTSIRAKLAFKNCVGANYKKTWGARSKLILSTCGTCGAVMAAGRLFSTGLATVHLSEGALLTGKFDFKGQKKPSVQVYTCADTRFDWLA